MLRRYKEAVTAVLISSSDSNRLPRRCCFTCANSQKSLHGARSVELGRCPNTSQPQRSNGMCTSRWRQGVALSWSKMTPCSSTSGLRRTARLTLFCKGAQYNTGHWPSYHLAQDGQAQVHFGWSTWRAWLTDHPDCPRVIYFLGDVRARHSAFPLLSYGSNECIHDSSTVKMRSMNAMASFLQSWRTRAALSFLVLGLWTPLCTNFSFPKAAGEDTVNICWKDSNFHNNYRSWNTASAIKDRFYLFHVTFIRRQCWDPTAWGIVSLPGHS